jgi:Raf kinase inhibitor-like YbhB/YbcL family protein
VRWPAGSGAVPVSTGDGGYAGGMAGIEMRSSAFRDNDAMPDRLTRTGGNASPPLNWSGVPAGTAQLVLLCEDQDAPRAPFLHWLVTGIDPTATDVPEGAVPVGGQEWPNGFGDVGYAGPQPPIGDDPHRYFFRIYALPGPVNLPVRPSTMDVHNALDGGLASGVLVGTFAR